MFVVMNRYSIINSADGIVYDQFDDGKEKEIYEHAEKMQKEGYTMQNIFIHDANGLFHIMPLMIWHTMNEHKYSEE